jgi:WD40 repeat protein
MLASGSDDNTVRLWETSTGHHLMTLRGHTDHVRAIAFEPSGQYLASGSRDGTVKLWNVQTGECLKTLRYARPYERMNITGTKGLNEAQMATLKSLGAIENESFC